MHGWPDGEADVELDASWLSEKGKKGGRKCVARETTLSWEEGVSKRGRGKWVRGVRLPPRKVDEDTELHERRKRREIWDSRGTIFPSLSDPRMFHESTQLVQGYSILSRW